MGTGWINCPNCGSHVLKVRNDTRIINLPAYCKRCKKELIVSYRKHEPQSRAASLN